MHPDAILPVKNQLIANVSSVPKVRQLTALRTDLVCVSAPRHDITRCASLLDDDRRITLAPCVRPCRKSLMDRARDYVHFAPIILQTL